MTNRISNRDYEALSAYLDGELAPKERSRLESRLLSQPELRKGLQELRQTRQVLRAQARIRPRRSFTLTPEMVGGYKPRKVGLQLFPVFGMATALASLALVVTFLFGFLNTPGDMSVALAPQSSEVEQAVELQQDIPAAAAESSELPAAKSAPGEVIETQTVESVLPTMMATPTPDMGILAAPPPGMGGGGDAGSGAASAAESLPAQEFPAPSVITETAIMSLTMEMAESTAQPDMDVQTPAAETALQAPGESASEASQESFEQTAPDAESEAPFSWWTPLRIIQLILGGLVLTSGLAALFFWILERA
jgi:anti-sigma factor RsiW